VTFSEIRDLLRNLIGSPNTTNVPDATLNPIVNRSYKHIATRFRFQRTRPRRTFSTVYGQVAYSLAADETMIFDVWNKTTNRPLKRVDSPQLYVVDGTTQYPNDYDEPRLYYREGTTIQLYKPPDAVYVIEYRAKITPADLSANGDTPILPDSWHEGIAYLARWYYFDQIIDYPKAQYAMNTWKLWLSDKNNEYDEETQAFEESVDVFPSTELNRRNLIGGDDW